MWKQYRYIEHRIQGLQDFVDYIFLEVLFRAPEHPAEELLAVVDEPTKKFLLEVKGYKFYEQLSLLYDGCKSLDDGKVNFLRTAYSNNNQIERLCRKEIKPFRFEDLLKVYKDDEDWKALLNSLKKFCNDLYTEYVNLKAFQDRYGTLSEYYKTLVKNDSICHCCGIGSILTEDNDPRDAFDHYLPKALYPFVSLNFHNLVPTCYHCNSSYKRESDTLFVKRGRKETQVKAFIPFLKGEASSYEIYVNVEMITHYKREETKKEDINVICSCPEYPEECDNWMRVYQIKERYTSYCHKQENLSLINDIIELSLSNPDFAKMEIQKMERNLNIHEYFLLAPFVRAVFKSLGKAI